MNKKPLIGITIDGHDPATSAFAKEYSDFYWYAQRGACVNAVIESGGLPIMLPHDTALVEEYSALINGLIISGGGHDTPAEYYGEKDHPSNRIKLKRSCFEKEIYASVYKKNKPILGICGGMQLIAALEGGKMHPFLPDDPQFQEHTQDVPANQVFHKIKVIKESNLYNLLDQPNDDVWVNSVHRQGVKSLGKNHKATAFAEDNLIEAFEDTNHSFCIGIQWHPEFLITKQDKALFNHFIQKAKV